MRRDRSEQVDPRCGLNGSQRNAAKALSPCASREEWEQLLDSNHPEMRDLLVELACFADLWRYFEEHEQRLGPNVVRDIAGLHKLRLAERIAQLKRINRKLMRRVNDAGKSFKFRQ
jgi:hypothetical protein